ncbi:reverse transcriptase domain-containing protein, partial [Tanacetum coccineum]
NLETKFDGLANKKSGRPFGSLPCNTQPNPRGSNSKAYQLPQARNEHVNAVFTRSGKSYNPPENPNEEQNKTENPINFDSDDEEDEPTPQPMIQTQNLVKETPLPKPYKPKIPYFQIPINPKDQEKTTFTCPFETYAYRRMPFGLCNAPATFQRCMLAIFHGMIEESVEVFMDDFSVFGNTFDKCLNNLDKMLQHCKDAHHVLNWEKCHFMVKEGNVLGRKVSSA